jgi:uncharacterized RDD family membrane protein YckC
MSKPINHDLERPILYKQILSSLINALAIALLGLACYFLVCQPILNSNGDYSSSIAYKNDREIENNLRKTSGLDYKEYSGPVDRFWLESFPNEVAEIYNDSLKTDYTIQYLYNLNVCRLPANPTPANYSTAYFAYEVNEDGSIAKDKIAIVKTSTLNSRGLRDLADIYWNAYEKLPSLFSKIDPSYEAAISRIRLDEGLSRLSSVGFSFLVFEIVWPLIERNASSLGEKILGLGYVNTNGFRVRKWKIPLRGLLMGAPALCGSFVLNVYSVTLLWVAPFFFNLIFMLFSKDNQSLADRLCFLICVDLKNSDIYVSEDEKEKAERNALGVYSDREYVNRLSEADEIKERKD